MPEGYCVKCRAKVQIKDAKATTLSSKRGPRHCVDGQCPNCGARVVKFVPAPPK